MKRSVVLCLVGLGACSAFWRSQLSCGDVAACQSGMVCTKELVCVAIDGGAGDGGPTTSGLVVTPAVARLGSSITISGVGLTMQSQFVIGGLPCTKTGYGVDNNGMTTVTCTLPPTLQTCGPQTILETMSGGTAAISVATTRSLPKAASSTPALGASGKAGTIAIGDLDGDNSVDIVTNLATGPQVLFGSAGTFSGVTDISVPQCPLAELVVADFLGLGKNRLQIGGLNASAGKSVFCEWTAYKRSPASSFSKALATSGERKLVSGDLDGDGRADIAYFDAKSNQVFLQRSAVDATTPTLLPSNPLDEAAAWPPIGVPASTVALAIGDFNGDGKLDLALAAGPSTVQVYLGYGTGKFSTAIFAMLPANPTGLAVADFNRDGVADLAIATSGGIVIAAVQGSQLSVQAATGCQVASPAIKLAAADVDLDGYQDIVIGHSAGTGGFAVCFNDGIGRFTTVDAMQALALASDSIAVQDLDANGVPDVVLNNQNKTELQVNLLPCK